MGNRPKAKQAIRKRHVKDLLTAFNNAANPEEWLAAFNAIRDEEPRLAALIAVASVGALINEE